MKGMVFREFCDMVERHHSPELLDELIQGADLPSGGAYTSVGTYDHREMLTLVGGLSRCTGLAAGDLVHGFGRHLLGVFRAKYPAFFEAAADGYAFLDSIDRTIHVEVRKLYPDAELPRFDCSRLTNEGMRLDYSSGRPFAHLAHGLIEATMEHYGHAVDITREDLAPGDGTRARFMIRPRAG
ncbi:MAG: hypothetical protein RLY86_3194 [Pseudomonadota bacterium]|jgi:hypothetical protein